MTKQAAVAAAKEEDLRAIELKSVYKLLSMDSIGVLTQHRRTFLAEEIRAKADNICKYGLFEPVLVVGFSKKTAQDYIDLTNQHYKTNHCLSELPRLPGGLFPLLLSGEVRFRSHKSIWDEGCSVCRERFGQEKPGTCYRRHFNADKANKMIEVKLFDNMPAIIAIDIQLSGNSYTPPPENEMVEGLSFQFLVKKKLNPSLTIARFARSVGKSAGTIGKYLEVFNLPEEIYEYYKSGYIPYGIAVELAFLKKNGESDLKWWAMRAIIGRLKTDDFRRKVRHYLGHKDQTILEIIDEETGREEKKRYIRETVAKETLEDIHRGIAYWKKVARLFQEGKLGKKDSPYSEGSPVALYRKQVSLMEQEILPHLEQFLPKSSLDEIKKTVALASAELKKIEQRREEKKKQK